MKKITIKFLGTDSWNRPVYEDENGKMFKDTNLGKGNMALCTVYGGFEGEPDTPIQYIKKYQDVEFVIENTDNL